MFWHYVIQKPLNSAYINQGIEFILLNKSFVRSSYTILKLLYFAECMWHQQPRKLYWEYNSNHILQSCDLQFYLCILLVNYLGIIKFGRKKKRLNKKVRLIKAIYTKFLLRNLQCNSKLYVNSKWDHSVVRIQIWPMLSGDTTSLRKYNMKETTKLNKMKLRLVYSISVQCRKQP